MAELDSTYIEEFVDYLDSEKLDGLRAVLVAILMENTEFDADTIYSFVYNGGRKIIWT
jgi:hypothetical protein